MHYGATVGSRLSERIGTEGCSDNRNVRIFEVLTNSIDNTCLKKFNNINATESANYSYRELSDV